MSISKHAFSIEDVVQSLTELKLWTETITQAKTLSEKNLSSVSAVEKGGRGALVFVDKADFVAQVTGNKPTLVVTSEKLRGALADVSGASSGEVSVIVVKSVPLAHAFLKQKFGARNFAATGWEGIHPSAVVHPSAEIAGDAVIEPRAVVGANTKIGSGSRVMAGVVVENDVRIGSRVTIHPNVTIGYGTQIGNDVTIEAGTVIGSEGFGFAQDSGRKSHAIPQTGIVVLEDRVRVGAGCCIDRAAYEETRIGAGTKIDNLCHIAHNVKIGQDCLLTAMLCVAGSTTIGNRVITSGQTGIIDHMNVVDDVVLLHRAGVTKDVEKPGAYAGLPLQPLTDYMKNQAVLRNAVELRQRVSDLEKK